MLLSRKVGLTAGVDWVKKRKNLPVPGIDPRSSNAQAVTVLVSINNFRSPSIVASSPFGEPLDCGTNKAVHTEGVNPLAYYFL